MDIEIGISDYRIRSFSNNDIPSLSKHANNPRIAANLRNVFPYPYNSKDAEKWIEFTQKEIPECNFAIANLTEVIGGIGIEILHDVYFQVGGVGYWLSEEYWNHGIMTKAVMAFTEYAFNRYDLIRIFAYVFETNPASARVLEKAGYSFEHE
ncbi:GNAT family N-acetyltransferase [Thermodesulfobacteriota bacterium]